MCAVMQLEPTLSEYRGNAAWMACALGCHGVRGSPPMRTPSVDKPMVSFGWVPEHRPILTCSKFGSKELAERN